VNIQLPITFADHLKICRECREAITESDLCLDGHDLWLDQVGRKPPVEVVKH
jgi:hypothetical protein